MNHAIVPAVLGLAAVAALPFVSVGVRDDGMPRCSRDGVPLTGLFRAWAASADGDPATFCSVRCAEDWLARHGGDAATVAVADERTGARVPAAEAWFVRSPVETSRSTGERIHAFRLRADADRHAAVFGGRVLAGDDRPLGAAR